MSQSSPDIVKLANKIEEIAKRSWNGGDARAIRDAATALRASLQLATPTGGEEPVARVPKVRTSHHRNKEEAARLQELVDKRYATPTGGEEPVAWRWKPLGGSWIYAASDADFPDGAGTLQPLYATPATMAQSSPDSADTSLKRVQLFLCQACLDGVGEECHTPGCALYLHRVDLPIPPELYTVVDDTPSSAGIESALRDAFPHFQNDELVTPEAIAEIGRDWSNMMTNWMPVPREIKFWDQDGVERKLVWEEFEHDAGWVIPDDADWSIGAAQPSAGSEEAIALADKIAAWSPSSKGPLVFIARERRLIEDALRSVAPAQPPSQPANQFNVGSYIDDNGDDGR